MLNKDDFKQMLSKAIAAGNKSRDLAREKGRFNPFTSALHEGDVILLNIVDKEGKLIFATDERGGTYVLSTLMRKGRTIQYAFYPSMMSRVWELAIEGKSKGEDPQFIQNEGIPNLLIGESIEDYTDNNLVAASISIQRIKTPLVWKFTKDAYKPGKKDYTASDFEKKKGNVYSFGITEHAIPDDQMVKLDVTADELFAEATKPQIN